MAQNKSGRRCWRMSTGDRQNSGFSSALSPGADRLVGFIACVRPLPGGWFFFFPLLWLLLMINNYDVIRASSWGETSRGVLFSGIGGVGLYLAVYFTYDPGTLPLILNLVSITGERSIGLPLR